MTRIEEDEQIGWDVPEGLQAVWQRVKRLMRAGSHRSRLETFLEWCEENPDEVTAILASSADKAMRADVRARKVEDAAEQIRVSAAMRENYDREWREWSPPNRVFHPGSAR